jgi:hypothetical protein
LIFRVINFANYLVHNNIKLMKTIIKIISVCIMLIAGIFLTTQEASAQVSFQVFYDELSPYGTWVDYSDYGYVWVPTVSPGFTPYATNGYWVFTDDGWTWVSNYSWGWAPFHYGRWYTDATYGPMWIPDYQWSPGWVVWRSSAGYYGWAPMGPGVSIEVAYSSGYNVPYNHWTFVKDRDFGRRNINNYYINSSNNVTIINNSTVINNTHVDKTHNVTYNAGPDRTDVEKHAGKKFTPVTIKDRSKPGENMSNNQLELYRPQVQKNSSTGHKPAPSKVEDIKNVKNSDQRTSKTPSQKTNQGIEQKPSQPKKINPVNKGEGAKQPKQAKPENNGNRINQPNPSNPNEKGNGVKQPEQSDPNEKSNGIKKPSQSRPNNNNDRIKQPNQTDPNNKGTGVKQPNQSKPAENDAVKKQTKSTKQTNPNPKNKQAKQNKHTKPPRKRAE